MRKIFLTLFLLAVSLIWAGNYWNQSQVTLTQDEDADYWGFKNNHLAEYYLNNLYLEIGLNTFLSEISSPDYIEERSSYVTNEIKSFTIYNITSNSSLKLGFNNNYYDYNKSTTNTLVEGIGLPSQTLAKNYSYLVYEGQFNNLQILSGVRYRTNYYDHQIDLGGLINTAEYHTYDEFYKDIYLAYNLSEEVRIYSDFYNKTFYSSTKDFLDPKREYDVTEYGLGVNYTSKDFFNGKLVEDFYYEKRLGDNLQEYEEDYFVNSFRYVLALHDRLNAFCSYISHFSYDSEDKEFYRLANMVRMQLRYNISYDDGDSYILAGTRLNPENQSRRYFVEVKYPLMDKLYCRVNETYYYETYNSVSTALEYYLTSASHIYVENNYTDSLDDFGYYSYKNQFLLGARMYF